MKTPEPTDVRVEAAGRDSPLSAAVDAIKGEGPLAIRFLHALIALDHDQSPGAQLAASRFLEELGREAAAAISGSTASERQLAGLRSSLHRAARILDTMDRPLRKERVA